MAIQIDLAKCTACGDCVASCPFGLIEIVDEKVHIDEGCTFCGACQEVCSYEAILIETATEAAIVSDSHRGTWVFAEVRGGKLKSVGYELLAKGRELADILKTELCAICFGHNIREVEQLIAYGADKVYLIDNPALASHQEDLYTKELVRLVQEHKPEIVIAGATSLGRSFIPRAAAILKTGLTADCTGLEFDSKTGLLLQTRPTFGGNVMATIICQTQRPQMSTVRPRVFKKNTPERTKRDK